MLKALSAVTTDFALFYWREWWMQRYQHMSSASYVLMQLITISALIKLG